MLLRIGTAFEIEIHTCAVYVRVGSFERFYNRLGVPTK